MSGQPESAYVNAVDWPDRPRDTHPDTLAWIARIEAVRAGPTRRCLGGCERALPLDERHFNRNRGEVGGRSYVCRDCDAARKRARRRRLKVAQFRAIFAVGRAS